MQGSESDGERSNGDVHAGGDAGGGKDAGVEEDGAALEDDGAGLDDAAALEDEEGVEEEAVEPGMQGAADADDEEAALERAVAAQRASKRASPIPLRQFMRWPAARTPGYQITVHATHARYTPAPYVACSTSHVCRRRIPRGAILRGRGRAERRRRG